MSPQDLKSLAEVFGQDLAGWKLAEVYFLELAHRSMGTFPAITADGEVVFTADRRALHKVWLLLPSRDAKVSSRLALVHVVTGVAFSLGVVELREALPLRIMSDEEIDKLDSVRWSPGLFSLGDSGIRPDFS